MHKGAKNHAKGRAGCICLSSSIGATDFQAIPVRDDPPDDGKGVIMASATARNPNKGSSGRNAGGPRSMWSGSITFGLVSIPVRLFTATREHRIRFHLLKKKDHSRIQRKYISSSDEKEESVANEELVRGYELSPNQFVILSDEELEALQPKDSRTIEITKLVDLDDIDPLFFDKPYYLAPGERAAKPYRLLLEALKKTKKVGISQFVMRKKEYLAALHAHEHEDVICLYTMRFADEIIRPDSLPGIEGDVHLSDKEVKMATELVDSLADKFDPDEFHDQYRKHVEELIERKAKGEEIVEQPEPEERPHKVINLMAALQASLNEAKKNRRRIPHHTEQETTRRRKAG